MSSTVLKDRLDAFKVENPQARLIDIARSMNITELEAVHCQVDNQTILALRTDWIRLFEVLPSLGRVMALTRNEYVVHECKGHYGPASWKGTMGLVHSETIDLRMFSSRWAHLYAVQVKNPRGLLHSFQIFDAQGRAVHKIFLEPGADASLYAKLVDELKTDHPERPNIAPSPLAEAYRAMDAGEIDSFRRDWAALQDTHEFFGLLLKHKVPRLQAMEIAGQEFVREVSPTAITEILEKTRDEGEGLMVFVGNPGMIQIYSGPVRQVKRVGDWINVLDPDFNLHLHEKGVGRVFVVHKPTRYGPVSSLEVFSPAGELLLSLFGCRKDDQQQAPRWGQLLATLPAF